MRNGWRRARSRWRHNTRGWEGNCHEADYYAGGALGAAGWKPARATPGYFSQMVTGGALTIPTVRTAAVSPGATKPAGMRALICSTPIMPGALPAYRMSALTPEMVNEIARSGCG